MQSDSNKDVKDIEQKISEFQMTFHFKYGRLPNKNEENGYIEALTNKPNSSKKNLVKQTENQAEYADEFYQAVSKLEGRGKAVNRDDREYSHFDSHSDKDENIDNFSPNDNTAAVNKPSNITKANQKTDSITIYDDDDILPDGISEMDNQEIYKEFENMLDVEGEATPLKAADTDDEIPDYLLPRKKRKKIKKGNTAAAVELDYVGDKKIDLHNYSTFIQAKAALNSFISRSIGKGYKSVLVIHGKGNNSPGGIAVLKNMVECYKTDGAYPIKSMQEAPRNLGGSGAKIIFL